MSTLDRYTCETFTDRGRTRDVFRRGEGPAVIVLAEMPGITPKVIEFADRVVDLGCTAVLPHLFGTPGRDPNEGGRFAGAVAMVGSLAPACISREFTVLTVGATSPVVEWLRALAANEHARCGGPGVGAVGMCFTGGFALAMAVDDRLVAPVMSQPALPLAVTRRRGRSIDLSPEDLATVGGRCAAGDLRVMGLRFEGDPLVPADRFAFLREQLGDAFVGIELPASAANSDSALPPHSVLTEHLVDEPGAPTRDALDEVLDFLGRRLMVT